MGKQSREKWEKREFVASGNIAGGTEYKTGLEKTCIFIIRWGTYASLFVPLVVMTQFFFPFVAPKTTIFRILVEIIFTAYLFLAVSNRRYRPRLDALTMSLTAFLAIFILASFTGINLGRSFWSTYERMTGIFTMLHLYAFFIILKSVFRKREDWEKFLGVSIFSGVCLSIYVLRGSEFSTRGGGTIGNSSFLAAYLLFDIFFALILFLTNFLKKEGWPLFWQIFSGISLMIMLPVFLGSSARGAIASFFLGLAVFLLGYLIFSGKKILKRIALALVLMSVASAVFLLAVKPAPVQQKAEAISMDMKSRFVVWDAGLKGFLERPVLGWGPENFNAVFQKHFNPCMSLARCGSEVWFDRTHNIIFDTLVTTGIVGLVSYLFIFSIAIYSLFKMAVGVAGTRHIFWPIGLSVLLITYFFQNLLVFDMINSYLVFFLTLSFAGFLTGKKENREQVEGKNRPLGFIFASAVVIVMVFAFWVGNVQPMIANSYLIKMASSNNAQDFAVYFQKSLETWMEKYETREQASQRLVRSGSQVKDLSRQDQEIFLQVYDLGQTEMEKSIQENYLDFRHYLFAGELYLASYRIDGNSQKIDRAESILTRAIELSPTNQQGYWQMAEVKLAQGRVAEAIPFLKKAVEIDPRVGRAHWYLALGYKIAGNYELSKEAVLEAKKREGGEWESLDRIKQVIDIYRALGDDKELVGLYLKTLEMAPNDAQLWALLAASYANLGQYDKAEEAARKTIEFDPTMSSKVDKFLRSLSK